MSGVKAQGGKGLPQVYLCGPMVPEGTPPNGGYAAANARTLGTLRTQGCQVQALAYPRAEGDGLAKLQAYVRGFYRLLAELSVRQPGVLHVTGLYKQFALPEWLLIRKARRLGFKTIYDIRAGSMLVYYQRLGPAYRVLFRSLLRSADRVMIEGMEYEEFVHKVTGRRPYYFPNHIDVIANAQRRWASDGRGPVLIYVGRVTLEKGVETLLDAARNMSKMGIKPRVWLVGPADADLKLTLHNRYADVEAQWFGSKTSEDVMVLLSQAHFFVFPTRHTGEGHSNALTEAMSMGCVPVVSRNGFNASVVGDAGEVLAFDADGEAYSAVMSTKWRGGHWAKLSAKAIARAGALFNSKEVIAKLRAEYGRLGGA